ncbi:unnamed protein product [Symbiodinium necroappetens]|uniref:Uncharacterized protein n=1 Tax=Symbiodinium necroappetens TaxID=1628268 RepID=A0A812WC73_9DINO|nr:unnamed protein product [Symbiodinium necroappetens]
MGFGDASAKDKKAAAAKAKDEAAKAAAEDAAWAETDKGNLKKAARAADAAAKADAKLAAKAELKEMEKAEEEANTSMKGANKKAGGYGKVTQAEIARRQAVAVLLDNKRSRALMAVAAKANPKKQTKKTEVVPQPKLEVNTNRIEELTIWVQLGQGILQRSFGDFCTKLMPSHAKLTLRRFKLSVDFWEFGFGQMTSCKEASGIDAALSALDVGGEKKSKMQPGRCAVIGQFVFSGAIFREAACGGWGFELHTSMLELMGARQPPANWAIAVILEFEARELENIKQERCFKMWERSPENPKNQEK